MTVIDGENNSVITTITVGGSPSAFCWNSIQNRVYVANYNGSSISVIRDVLPGVEENATATPSVRNDFVLYPNPARSVLCVPFSGKEVGEIKIFDTSGKLIKEVATSWSNNELIIPLKDVNPGVYFLRLGKDTRKFQVVK